MKRLLVLALLILFYSCSDQTENAKNQQISDTDRALAILEKQGFDMSKIVVDGDEFIVDGDARLAVNTVLATEGRNKQWRTEYIMTQSNSANIKIRIASNVPSVWKTATRAAIANWNAINNTKLQMTEVSSGEDMLIKHESSSNFSRPTGTIAEAKFPDASGNVGYQVRINDYFDSRLSANRKIFTMTHEIGHCIGFRHTNWFDRNSDGNATTNDREPQLGAQHIPGTPTGLDGNSVMNAIVQNWNGFSQYDEVAVRYLYPSSTTPPPSSGITGPQDPAAGQYATYTAPQGSSYQWWYNLGSRWVRWNGVTSRSVTFRYTGTLSLAVVVNGSDVYYKRNITF